MREIKFRAWDSKNKYMVDESYGNWISFDGILYEEAGCKYNTPHVEIEKSKDLILMQYTGIKDKNDKELCEGDLIKFDIDKQNTKPHEIWFENGAITYWSLFHMGQRFTIVGNIYENPELLKNIN